MLETELVCEIHPAANIFPMMSTASLNDLAEDIQENGLKEPIVFYDGKLLDGRNRFLACKLAGIEPDAAEIDVDGDFDPVAWVLSMNLHRRHLSETQREAIAAKVANLKHGDVKSQKDDPQNCASHKTVNEAAEQLNVKPRSVENAKSAIKGGCDELIHAMEAGEIPSSTAANLVKAVPDKKEQAKIVKQGIGAVRQIIKESKQDQPRPSTRKAAEKPQLKQDESGDLQLTRLRPKIFELSRSQLIVVQEWISGLLD